MSSHASSGKPPTGLPPKLPTAQSAGTSGGGFVSRYKLQQQRIRTLNQMETTAADLQKRIQKSLPKVIYCISFTGWGETFVLTTVFLGVKLFTTGL